MALKSSEPFVFTNAAELRAWLDDIAATSDLETVYIEHEASDSPTFHLQVETLSDDSEVTNIIIA